MQTLLSHRSVLRISGADAASFLQGIMTQDIFLLQAQPLIFSAMLSAQGKFQHDFFILSDTAGGYLIDIDSSHAAAFLQKLKMYKLRSKVSMEETPFKVFAAWQETPQGIGWHPDPRLPALGWRCIAENLPAAQGDDASARGTYDTHRLALGVPDGAQDATDRHFLLELGYDVLQGVSFKKGCFVGQEPTARMHYRKLLRKCFFMVHAESGTLPPVGTPLMHNAVEVGEMRSAQAAIGLAFCRIQNLEGAQHCFNPGGGLLTLSPPPYLREKLAEVANAHNE